MKVGKPKSKRVPVRLRHKIAKASSAKQRKDRKTARKDPTWRSKLKKDPGIPNLFPYKDRVLKEIEEGKKKKEEDALRRRELARAQREGIAMPDGAAENRNTKDANEEEDSDALLDLEDDGEQEDEYMEADEKSAPTENPMAALLASARARASQYEQENVEEDGDAMEDDEDNSSFGGFSPPPAIATLHAAEQPLLKTASRKSHSAAVSSLISSSDILLYILDARDPASTRSPAIEQSILANPDKRLILILNKIDLVPAAVLKSWLLHLRRFFPTLPLRAGASAPNAKTFDHKHLTTQFTADNVIKALKNSAAAREAGRTLRVGVLGYPNVGKSSAVNALTSRLGGRGRVGGGKECPVGADAGVTTALREVKLDGSIKLIDSPGVVFPSQAGSSAAQSLQASNGKRSTEEHARLVLLNAVPPKEIGDPVPAVSLLLKRLSSSGADAALGNGSALQKLLDVYGIPALMSDSAAASGHQKDVTTPFLIEVARKRGRLGKGGVPNLHAAAQTVIGDWRDGRIQGWADAPKPDDVVGAANVQDVQDVALNALKRSKDEKVVVTEWAKEFKIEGLWGGDGGMSIELEDGADVAML